MTVFSTTSNRPALDSANSASPMWSLHQLGSNSRARTPLRVSGVVRYDRVYFLSMGRSMRLRCALVKC